MTTLKNSNRLNVYKKIEKSINMVKNPYEIVKILLDDLSRIMHLLILEIDKKNAFLIITHYQRLLDYIKPDFIHVLSNGKIIKTGSADLGQELEKTGYENLK